MLDKHATLLAMSVVVASLIKYADGVFDMEVHQMYLKVDLTH